MSAGELVFIYTTVSDMAAAEKIASAVVEPGLAACVNIYPGMRSVYRWQGKVEMDEETGLFVKVRKEDVPQVMDTIRAAHEYDVPALLELPIGRVGDDYLAWAREQTARGR
mgnify:CR=1 FL=1